MLRSLFALLVLLSAVLPAAAAEPALRVDLRFRSPLVRIEIRLPVLAGDAELQRRLEEEAMEEARSFLQEVWEEALDPELRDSPLSPRRVPRELRRTVTSVHRGARLLALRIETFRYTGGAHGLVSLDGLLWDRVRRRTLALDDLLDVEGAKPALRAALNAALRREKARRGPVEPDVRVDEETLALAGVVVLPGPQGRGCGLRFLFSPYLLGSFAEGSYELDVPTAVFAPWLRPAWRDAFADCGGARGDADGGAGRLDSGPDAAR